MDDFMLMEYLKNKGMGEHEFMNKFKEFMNEKFRRDSYRRRQGSGGSSSGGYSGGSSRRHGYEGDFYPMDNERMMYDDFFMRKNSNYPGEFMNMFGEDRNQDDFYEKFRRMTNNMSENDMYEMMKMMKEKKGSSEDHFNDSYARYLVSNMYHYENGRKYVGEKFDMAKAKEVCERYRGIIPQTVTHADVYVAINAQYHDYCELFKSWFSDNAEQKIIESAIIFWFKDDDYTSGFKLWDYFNE